MQNFPLFPWNFYFSFITLKNFCLFCGYFSEGYRISFPDGNVG